MSPQTPKKRFIQLGDRLLIFFTFLDSSFITLLINCPTHFRFQGVIWNYAFFLATWCLVLTMATEKIQKRMDFKISKI
jgi:hypothetical protein